MKLQFDPLTLPFGAPAVELQS